MATGWQLVRARGWQQLSKPRIVQILRVLGIATFALLPPLALILVRSEPRLHDGGSTQPAIEPRSRGSLALGLLIHRRTTAKRLAAWQTAGTAIVVLAGAAAGAAGRVPPGRTRSCCSSLGLINCAILAVLGVVAELPLLYVPSVACAALATTIGLHWLGGHFADREPAAAESSCRRLCGARRASR